jgi:hypothetical protein
VASRRGVQNQAIAPHADGISEGLRGYFLRAFAREFRPLLGSDMRFDYGEFRLYSAASQMYAYFASPSSVPAISLRNLSPGQPEPPSGRGHSVCNQ